MHAIKKGNPLKSAALIPVGCAAGSTTIYFPACKPSSLGAHCRGGRAIAFNWGARIRKILSPFNYSGQSGLKLSNNSAEQKLAKIVYGVSGEGSGHSSRSREMLAHLKDLGHDLTVVSYDRGYLNLKDDFD